MATWDEIKRFIHQQYKAEDTSDSMVKLVFDTGNSRPQMVVVEHAYNGSAQWMKVNSPIGRIGDVDLARACEAVGTLLVGGVIVHDGYVPVMNAMPLDNLDPNETIDPIERVMQIADDIERDLLGRDAV